MVKQCNFDSLMCNTVTDSTFIKKGGICVLFADPDHLKVKVCSLIAYFLPWKQPLIRRMICRMSNVVFSVSDGSSVNTGLKNGLVKFFRDKMPWVGIVWCFSYRSEFVLKDALSEWMNPIVTNLQSSYYVHEKPSKKSCKLKKLYDISNRSCRYLKITN